MAKPEVAKSAISPRRAEDFPEWYQQVIRAGDMAESSDVRGCMVIKPWGYGIWENMQRALDAMFKATGHKNAYFPLFIPLSYMQKEAEHVEGFAKECAVVTHHRLELNAAGKMVPASPLTEPLVVRPTSETIIGASYAKWVQSYRDLPILINQWANVVRWEMRPRLFLRTTEFLWQEGHTVHETEAEARAETRQMLDVYETFVREHLAIPVFTGEKSESERFPGAVQTLCIEALVQDRKAIQAGTSHFLGQNFSRSIGIRFQTRDGKQEFGWTTSWGMTTRLIGATIMVHSDDEGLVLPPRVAPDVAAVVPIYKTPEEEQKVRSFIDRLVAGLTGGSDTQRISRHGIESYLFDASTDQRIVADFRDARPGDKQYHWEQRGVPFRMEVGPRDVDSGAFMLKSRLDGTKQPIKLDEVTSAGSGWLRTRLDAAHRALFDKALRFREENTRAANTYDEMKKILKEQGGFVRAYFEPDRAAEARIKDETKATVRCIPFDQPPTPGKSIYDGRGTRTQVLFAQAY